MHQYHNLLQQVLDNGFESQDRTGTGTISIFGSQMRFDLTQGFPAITTKRLAWKAVVSELLWFLEGSDDERRLAEILYSDTRENLIGKNTIWTANADAQGVALGYENTDLVKKLGPVYGVQWRKWAKPDVDNALGKSSAEKIDQIAQLVHDLKTNPNGRRHILSAWNVGELDQMALPPCHCFAQFYVRDGKLSCQLYQRSNDLFLGVPFNIASYALLTHMLAQVTGLGVGEFIHTGGDVHIYSNHVEQVNEQLSRGYRRQPTLWIDPTVTDIDGFTMDSFRLDGYDPWPAIKAPMAV